MSESAQIVAVLKRSLKARGMTYRELARRVRLSEASIKRIFAEQTFTLTRLEEICGALDMSVAEIVRMATQHASSADQQLSLAQEEVLAGDARLFACFYLLQNGRTTKDLSAELALSERELRRLLVKLDAARLIELLPKMKLRLRTPPSITWRIDGPVHRLYEQQVKSEFLRSDFASRDQLLRFRSAELSDASAKILARKVETLARDFAELAALDVAVPNERKRSVGLLLALRPWVFSIYAGLKRRS